jgi:hypothetical protein
MPKEGEQQRMLDIPERLKIPTVSNIVWSLINIPKAFAVHLLGGRCSKCTDVQTPDPSNVSAEGEQQRMLDIQECFKIPTVS